MTKSRRLVEIRARAEAEREVHPTVAPPAPRWDIAFLAAIGSGQSVHGAASCAKVSRALVYKRRCTDPAFAAAWAAMARLTAPRGGPPPPAWQAPTEPVFYGGKQIGTRELRTHQALIRALGGSASAQRRDEEKPPMPNASTMKRLRSTEFPPDIACLLSTEATALLLAHRGLSGLGEGA